MTAIRWYLTRSKVDLRQTSQKSAIMESQENAITESQESVITEINTRSSPKRLTVENRVNHLLEAPNAPLLDATNAVLLAVTVKTLFLEKSRKNPLEDSVKTLLDATVAPKDPVKTRLNANLLLEPAETLLDAKNVVNRPKKMNVGLKTAPVHAHAPKNAQLPTKEDPPATVKGRTAIASAVTVVLALLLASQTIAERTIRISPRSGLAKARSVLNKNRVSESNPVALNVAVVEAQTQPLAPTPALAHLVLIANKRKRGLKSTVLIIFEIL